jgi:hypothetical protein
LNVLFELMSGNGEQSATKSDASTKKREARRSMLFFGKAQYYSVFPTAH